MLRICLCFVMGKVIDSKADNIGINLRWSHNSLDPSSMVMMIDYMIFIAIALLVFLLLL